MPLFHGGHGGHLPKLRCAAALRALPEEAEPSLGMLAQLLEAGLVTPGGRSADVAQDHDSCNGRYLLNEGENDKDTGVWQIY